MQKKRMDNLRVTLVQAQLEWENKAANLAYFEHRLEQLSEPTDLIVLPEMFSTGFSMQPNHLAEPMQGPTLEWMSRCANVADAVVTGSFIVAEQGAYYNRLVWMQPDGEYFYYDKRHLFSLAEEHKHYSPGNKQLLVEWRGWRIMPLICYDLRFPVWSRNTFAYDLLVYVANWPERRSMAWSTLLQARAIENQVYTIGVNRIGADGNAVIHSGDTSLYDFQGLCLYRASHVEATVTLTLNRQNQQNFREKFTFLEDKDEFTIH